ncbi:hypothetical protein KGQ19_12680 [Catenulispora sp. NL8]|uniref:Uncharacterized protein n=1 Tax=Catenulispora pinistramenti TaxID=2705254 RepID=A0ABS5KNU2_9ACTN|nr:hypothetical protein [Catenulispora pinistramenti]MBS2547723.1 hypothetical protein [Catenulispora pinistramenti]
MTDKPTIHSSRILALLDEILHDNDTTFQTIELVGRGISAEMRCTIAVINNKNRDPGSPAPLADDWVAAKLAAADKLMELGDLDDELDDLWHRRRTTELTVDEFEERLGGIVQRLEAWPAHLA